jgi:hypothetical protein
MVAFWRRWQNSHGFDFEQRRRKRKFAVVLALHRGIR